MSGISKFYPRFGKPYRSARNGFTPEAAFALNLRMGQNHVMAYRRKSFMTFGDLDNLTTSAAGTVNRFRFRCHSGHGATNFVFVLGLGLNNNTGGGVPPVPTDPYVQCACTIAGGATTSGYAYHGHNSGGVVTDTPNMITERIVKVAVTADTDYEVLISEVDYARILTCAVYEEASDEINSATNYYVDYTSPVGSPIYDSTIQGTMRGLSQIWRHNGPQLLTWPGGITHPTYASTTWTNVLDGGTGAVGAATPGFTLGDGDRPLTYLARRSDSTTQTVDVVLAVYCSVTNSATGEVRLEDASGTVCSITAMGTAAAWYTTTTAIAGIEAVSKVDLQARTSNAANTMTLHAVSMYAYLA